MAYLFEVEDSFTIRMEIRREMRKRNISMSELSRRMGCVSEQYVANMLGQASSLRVETFIPVMKALGMRLMIEAPVEGLDF